MDRGILSVKIMILGAAVFLFGCAFAERNSAAVPLALLAGPVIMLIGLLTGNRSKN